MLFDRSEGFPNLVGVAAERIERPFNFQPNCHVWIRSKHEHADIPDATLRYSEGLR